MTDKNPVIIPLQQWRKMHPQESGAADIIPMRPASIFICSMNTAAGLHPKNILEAIDTFINDSKAKGISRRLIIDMTHVDFVHSDLFSKLAEKKELFAKRGTLIIAGIDVPPLMTEADKLSVEDALAESPEFDNHRVFRSKEVCQNNTDQIGGLGRNNAGLNEMIRHSGVREKLTFCQTVEDAVAIKFSSHSRAG